MAPSKTSALMKWARRVVGVAPAGSAATTPVRYESRDGKAPLWRLVKGAAPNEATCGALRGVAAKEDPGPACW